MDLHLHAIIINFIVLIILLFYLRYDWSLNYATMRDQEREKLREFLRKKERFHRAAILMTIASLILLIITYIID